jgi:hypothetical protein
MKQDNIPETLNSPAQARANSHDTGNPPGLYPGAGPTPAQPIQPCPGAEMGCDAAAKALPYLKGEAEEAARRQLRAFGK